MFCMEPPAGFALLAIPKKLRAGRDLFQHQGRLLLLPLPWKSRSRFSQRRSATPQNNSRSPRDEFPPLTDSENSDFPRPTRPFHIPSSQGRIPASDRLGKFRFSTPNTHFPHSKHPGRDSHVPQTWKILIFPHPTRVSRVPSGGRAFSQLGNAGMAEPGGATGPELIPRKLFGSSSSSRFPAPRALNRSCFASARSKQEQLPREGFPEGSKCRIPFPASWMFLFFGFCRSDVSSRYYFAFFPTPS